MGEEFEEYEKLTISLQNFSYMLTMKVLILYEQFLQYKKLMILVSYFYLYVQTIIMQYIECLFQNNLIDYIFSLTII